MLPPVRPVPFTVERELWAASVAFVGVIEETCGPLKMKLLRFMSQAPRPWVAARRVREGSCSRKEWTTTRGSPVLRVLQVQDVTVQLPTKTPRSVAA